ncbi:MAG: FKBP-type peptidyl-prolyl cis-trans isomerase, partial [Candidatus Nanoarchaeia archaeon]|nr:FKBP-type peptidyl-prolyl cis-trans isomerase [Candidatus Nanoarchaeia archaeon]
MEKFKELGLNEDFLKIIQKMNFKEPSEIQEKAIPLVLAGKDVIGSSEKSGQPLEFEIGANQVIQGFEKAVLSMEKGEEKQIKIESKEAYDEKNEELIKEIPKNKLPGNIEPKIGMFLGLQTLEGET